MLNHSSDIDPKKLWIFTENIKKNYIIFWLMTQLYHQIILYDLEKVFGMNNI